MKIPLFILIITLNNITMLFASSYEISSPDCKHKLLFECANPNDISREMILSIVDNNKSVNQSIDETPFPINGVMWNKNSKCILLIKHITRREIIDIIFLTGEKWASVEVGLPDCFPDNFKLLNAVSNDNGFTCYFSGFERIDDKYHFVYKVNINSSDQLAKLVWKKRFNSEESINCFSDGISSNLSRIEKSINGSECRYSVHYDEPAWYRPIFK
jgi:hypothetical protein